MLSNLPNDRNLFVLASNYIPEESLHAFRLSLCDPDRNLITQLWLFIRR
jgi:hypothetical protein